MFRKLFDLRDCFVGKIFLYQIFGLFVCNIIIFIPHRSIYGSDASPFIYLFGIPALLLILILLLANNRLYNFEKLPKIDTIFISVLITIFHFILSVLIFSYEDVVLFALSIAVMGGSCIILALNRFDEYKETIELLVKEANIKLFEIVYEDLRMYIKLLAHGVIYFTLGMSAILTLIWTIGNDGLLPRGYHNAYSLGLLFIYCYIVFGFFYGIYIPLYRHMTYLRKKCCFF